MIDNGTEAIQELHAAYAMVDRKLAKVLESTLQTIDLIDPRDAYIDERGEVWSPVGMPGGRMQDLAVYKNELELQRIRDLGVYLASDNEWGRNIHQSRLAYIVGWGHTYKAVAKPDEKLSDAQLKEVNDFIATFLKANRWSPAYVAGAMQFDVTPGRGSWGFRQLQNLWRRDVMGECLIRKFPREDGILRLRYIESPALASPLGRQEIAPYGIETDPDDEETVLRYWVNNEPIDASEIQHRTRDGSPIHPRGIPINYPVRKNLVRAQKILRNGQAATELQVAIGMIRKHAQATKASITSMVASDATRSSTDAVTGNVINGRRYLPGSILDTTKGIDYEFPAQQINPAGYVATLGADLRAIAACHVMPEFMISADASNSNYSNTMVAEGPCVKNFEGLQWDEISYDLELIWDALRFAVDANVLSAGLIEKIEVQAEAPRVQTRDELKEAQRDEILNRAKVLSAQTWATRNNLDYDQEIENAKAHAENQGELMDLLPLPMVPGTEPGAPPNGRQQDSRAAQSQGDED